jgi:hypothetical protein
MEGFELSIVLDRPIEEVFGFLTNLENDLKWRREWVEAVKTSEGPIGIDSTFRLVGEFLGRKIPTTYEVIEYEPNRSAAMPLLAGSVKRQHEGDLRKVKELLEAHTV